MKQVKTLSIIILIMLSISTKTFSQGPWTVGAVVLGNFFAQDLIAQADRTAQKLMSQGESAGNALLIRTANQINVAIKNARLILTDELDKRFDQLDTHKKTLLYEMEKFRQSVENLKSVAFEFKDAFVVDIQSVIGDVVPWAKRDFLIQRIDGVTQLKKEIEYRFRFMGIGFGTNSDKLESKIKKVYIDNTETNNFYENKIHSNISEVSITAPTMNLTMTNDKPRFATIRVTVQVNSKKGWLIKRWSTHDYDFDFRVTLYPLYAGKIKVKYAKPKTEWMTVSPNVIYSYTTPNHHQDRKPIIHFPWEDYKSLPENQQFVNARYIKRGGSGCPWTEISGVEPQENGKVLKVWGETWGQSCTYFYQADIQELKITGEDFEEAEYNMEYGNNVIIDMPSNVKYWEIDGTTITLHHFNFVGKSHYKDLIEFEDIVESGNKKRAIYSVNFSNDIQTEF